MLEIIITYLVIQFLGFAILPLTSLLLSHAPDKGYAASKALGVMVFTLLVWALSRWGGFPYGGEASIFAASIILVLSGVVLTYQREILITTLTNHGRLVESLFLFGFIFFLVLRAFNPEIYWGEKPMDSSFLNYFTRIQTLPPQDPWATGSPLYYYYFGYLFWGLILKLPWLSTGVGYNVAFAANAAVYLTALFTVTTWITNSKRAGLFGALFIALISNFEMVWLVLSKAKPLNFDTYWASSRVMASPAFNEYPFWAFLFGDLHAHILTLPLVVTITAFGLELLHPQKTPITAVIAGVLLGALFGFNAWDIFTLSWLSLFLLLLVQRPWKSLFRDGVFFAGSALFVKTILGGDVSPNLNLHWGWVFPNEFNSLSLVLRHFGLFLLPSVLILLIIIFTTRKQSYWGWASLLFPLFLIPLFLSEAHPKAWEISLPMTVLGSLSASLLFVEKRKFETKVFLALFAAGVIGISVLEHIFIIDRMNSIFKLYHGIWFILGMAAVIALTKLASIAIKAKTIPIVAVCFWGLLIAPLLWGFGGSILSTEIMTSFRRVSGPRPTLDGTAFLSRKDGDEAKLIEWVNDTIKGEVPIVEAQGNSYGDFTRVTMHTGLPNLLGWGYHVTQRGTSSREVQKREEDIIGIYGAFSPEKTAEILKSYGIQYVVYGNVERREYGDGALSKFQNNPGLFKEAFSVGAVFLFEVL